MTAVFSVSQQRAKQKHNSDGTWTAQQGYDKSRRMILSEKWKVQGSGTSSTKNRLVVPMHCGASELYMQLAKNSKFKLNFQQATPVYVCLCVCVNYQC